MRFTTIFLCILFVFIGSVVAQEEESLTLEGLNDTVEIFWDDWGVPHIYASNVYDLAFAQGYIQAMDRWWQMEFSRHIAAGRLQELTGYNPSLMGTDVYLRTLGIYETARLEYETNYSQHSLFIIEAFADGVNAYISSHTPNELALEYRLLSIIGVEPEIYPWTPVDSIAWGKVMALQLGGNMDVEELLSSILTVITPEMLQDYLPEYPYDSKPSILLPEDLPITQAPLTSRQVDTVGIRGLDITPIGGYDPELAANYMPFGDGIGIGSNNWVASGEITETGLPLMANDMHLGIQMPSIWYEIGLHCTPVSEDCPYNVVGFAFSSSPLIVAGHNDRISWAFTNVGPDTQDLYQIRVNPDNDLQYEWDGEWRDMTVREETIRFGDDTDPITFQVRITHLGPIINDTLEGFNNDNPLALRWTSLEPGELFTALIQMNAAQNWQEFREALTYWDAPSQNIIYADVDGNIGYQMPGRIPIRAPGHTGQLPVPGWTSEYEWRGYIPFDYLPRIFNPERGWIASANQRVVPPAYYDYLQQELGDEFGADSNFTIHLETAYGYRGNRINTLLEDLKPHSIQTFMQMHGDNYDGSAAEILPYLADLTIEDAELATIRDWLLTWDYHMDMDSAQAVLYAHFWSRLANNIFNDQFQGVYRASGTNNELWAVYQLLQEPDNIWWDNIETDDIETPQDILLQSLQEAYDYAVETLGEDYTAWRWGAIHTTTFVSNPIGASGMTALEQQVNRGPVETAGTNNAINATSWRIGALDFSVRAGPSERVIYDLSDWSNSRSIHTTGQSGHPSNPHYDDMIDPWRNIEYRIMLWTREQVEAAAVRKLTLTPQ